MASITWYLTNALAGPSHQQLSETSPGANATTSPNYGWTVPSSGTNPRYSAADAQSERASTTFAATPVEPDGSIVTTAGAGDCWRTLTPYTGTFDTGNWTFQMSVIAVSGGGTQDGNAGFRLFRGTNADGAGATEITASRLAGSAVTNLTTSTQQNSIHNSTSIGTFSVNEEYLFVQVAWEHTGNVSMVGDVIHRIGTTASHVISTNFTPTAGREGPNDPASASTGGEGGGRVVWASPGNVTTSDDTKAIAAFTGALDEQTETLRATDFGFAIPGDATIDGIRVDVERNADGSGIQDLAVQLIKGGSISGDNKAVAADWPTTDTYASYGGSSQLWGLSWSPADINASNFGVAVSATDTSGAGNDARVDHIRITVYYTETSSAISQFMLMGVGV